MAVRIAPRRTRFVARAATAATTCALAVGLLLGAAATARAAGRPCGLERVDGSGDASAAAALSAHASPIEGASTDARQSSADVAAASALDEETSFLALTSHAPNCAEWTVTPAVIDCNSPDANIWVGQMIGSCAAPRGGSESARSSLRRGRGANTTRGPVCDLLGCGLSPEPLHRSPRLSRDERTAALSSLRVVLPVAAAPLAPAGDVRPDEPAAARLERPPRALSVR